MFVSAREKECYDIVKKRTLLVLEQITDGKDNEKAVEAIDDAQFAKYKPQKYIGPESVEVTTNKQYETSCLIISQKTGLKAKNMTVLEYYNALATIEKMIEAESKTGKQIGRR